MKIIRGIRQNRGQKGGTFAENFFEEAGRRLKKIPLKRKGETDSEYHKRLFRKVYPLGATTRQAPRLYKYKMSARSLLSGGKAKTIFGDSLKRLSFVVVGPELAAFSKDVRAFFAKLGCRVEYSKAKLMSADQVWLSIYKYLDDYPQDSIESAIRRRVPVRLMVIRYPPAEELLQHCRELGLTIDEKALRILQTHDFTAFFSRVLKGKSANPAPGTFRREVRTPILDRFGFRTMDGLSKHFDLGGYFSNKVRKGFNPYEVFSGLHAPDDVADCIKEATIYFSPFELSEIKKKLRI